MNLQLENKLALVTGSTAGIGFAIAKALAAEGARVTVNGRTPERVERAVQQIKKEVPNAHLEGIPADLGHSQGVDALTSRLPQLDILVNNLGIFEVKPFGEIT